MCVMLILQSCGYKSGATLFNNKENHKYYKAERKRTGAPVIRLKEAPDTLARYRLVPGESFTLRFVNYPKELLDEIATAAGIVVGGGGATGGGTPFGAGQDANVGGFRFTLNNEGYAALPLLGPVYLNGFTLEEIRTLLNDQYKNYVKNGDIFVAPATLRVQIFGEANQQQLLFLPREHMHLTEVLALAGGITYEAKVKRVQIIRGDLNNPQVIWVDLQNIQALSAQDLIVQHLDIIYLEPRKLVVLSREFQFATVFLASVNFIITLIILITR